MVQVGDTLRSSDVDVTDFESVTCGSRPVTSTLEDHGLVGDIGT
jgi:hypothetical protein